MRKMACGSTLLLLIWLAPLESLRSQSKQVLTLEEAIDIALERSFDTKTLGLRLESAGYGLNAAKGRFKTNAQWSLQFPAFTERVQEVRNANSLPVFNTLGTTRFFA